MNEYLACEIAYQNGFNAGRESVTDKGELCTRIKVAYEQLGKVHTELCREHRSRDNDDVLYDIQDILNAILKVQVKLGMLKREEDL